MGLTNIVARQARANELAGKVPPFDLVVCRAVGSLPDLVAETSRLLAPGGYLVCYKTPQMSDEERKTYLAESLFLNTVKYENDKLEAYMKKLTKK